jgi:uncharacterized protein with PIN domain
MYNSECPICFDSLDMKLHLPFNCNHSVCLECNDSLENRECPLCRAEIPIRVTRLEYTVFISGVLLMSGGLVYILKKIILL